MNIKTLTSSLVLTFIMTSPAVIAMDDGLESSTPKQTKKSSFIAFRGDHPSDITRVQIEAQYPESSLRKTILTINIGNPDAVKDQQGESQTGVKLCINSIDGVRTNTWSPPQTDGTTPFRTANYEKSSTPYVYDASAFSFTLLEDVVHSQLTYSVITTHRTVGAQGAMLTIDNLANKPHRQYVPLGTLLQSMDFTETSFPIPTEYITVLLGGMEEGDLSTFLSKASLTVEETKPAEALPVTPSLDSEGEKTPIVASKKVFSFWSPSTWSLPWSYTVDSQPEAQKDGLPSSLPSVEPKPELPQMSSLSPSDVPSSLPTPQSFDLTKSFIGHVDSLRDATHQGDAEKVKALLQVINARTVQDLS